MTIKLNRENYNDFLTDEERQHTTEVEIDGYNDFDYRVQNKSLASLQEAAHNIVKSEERSEVI